MYESQVSFTLDTTCPWTLLGKLRLDQALEQVRSTSPPVTFTVRFEPFQLDPLLPETVDKKEWYLANKHLGNQDAQAYAQTFMSTLFRPLDLPIRWDGPMGNTFEAHRVIQYFQEKDGPEVAGRIIQGLQRRYFTEAQHPAGADTLVDSCVEAGVDRGEAEDVVGDKSRGERAAREKLRSVAMDVDAVPSVRFEGRKRDITLTGARDVSDYVEALQTIIKEST